MKKLMLIIGLCLLALCGCSSERSIQGTVLEVVPTEEVYFLKDGTQLEIWQETNGKEYRLDDGTVLVTETNPNRPENTHVRGENGFEPLPESVQQKINTYYDEQGLLYDINIELERAYCSYQENPEVFSSWRFFQDVSLSASNENMVAFLTTVQVLDGKTTDDKRFCTIFDRTTGEKIDVYDLFVCKKEKVAEEILKAVNVKTETLLEEMKHAFRPEYILLIGDSLQISFPAGTLPSQEHEYIVSVNREKDLKGLFHEWAIPVENIV